MEWERYSGAEALTTIGTSDGPGPGQALALQTVGDEPVDVSEGLWADLERRSNFIFENLESSRNFYEDAVIIAVWLYAY